MPTLFNYCFRHSGLDPESSNGKIGALCAPLDTGLCRYDALLYLCRINREMQIYSVLSFPRKREPSQIKHLDSRFCGNDELICTSLA